MSRSVDTLYRQWLMLSKIPRYPRRITVAELKSMLSGEGYEIDIRTIQRDLIKLTLSFPLSNDIEGRKQYWYWIENAATQDLPGMDPVTALAFQMAESYLSPMLPQATLTLLMPYFSRAKEVLEKGTSRLKHWPKKVAMIGRGPLLIKPVIKPEVQYVIYQALSEEKQLRAFYKKRHVKIASEYLIHPLGIVNKQGVIYLVCTLWGYTDIKQFALHRFDSAELLDGSAKNLDAFNLASYVQEDHQFAYPLSSEPIQLKVLLEPEAAEHLYETPLAKDQVLTLHPDKRVLLEASIKDSHELRWWLNSFGANIEVLEPLALREHVIKEIQLMMNRYV